LKLAKPQVDIGLSTNNLDAMLAFWQGAVGLRLDHVLPVRRGQKQHRHSAAGSVVKINHHVDPLPDAPPSGYRELIIAQPARAAPLALSDPDAIGSVWFRRGTTVCTRSASAWLSVTSMRIAAFMPEHLA
jgi:hypothetical protein